MTVTPGAEHGLDPPQQLLFHPALEEVGDEDEDGVGRVG